MNIYNFMHKKITFLSILAFLLFNINTNAQDLGFSMLSANSFEKSLADTIVIDIDTNNEEINDSRGFTSRIRWGLALTPTFSSFRSKHNDINTRGLKLAVGWGIMADIPHATRERWILSTGLYFSRNGGKYEYDSSDTISIKNRVRIRHLEIPISLKFLLKERGDFQPFIQAGLVPAFRRSSNYTNYVNDDKEFDYARGRSITRFANFSGLFGAGVEYQLGKRTAFGGFYYMRGLKSVINDSDLKDTFGKKQRISVSSIRFRVGIFF
ncbi:MAG: porin family protein [Chitinophagales bacterium]